MLIVEEEIDHGSNVAIGRADRVVLEFFQASQHGSRASPTAAQLAHGSM
jgi:hypothetical protein